VSRRPAGSTEGPDQRRPYNLRRQKNNVALAPGARLGAYEILTLIGSGGMGEVYRARDAKLDRDVAIKVLPQALADDPDRLARFEREAKTLAALNHPNIAHIHGFEDSTGTPALVMELVEGPTLSDRIAKGPIALDEALAIAKQIAEALEAAHEQGIVHRDLKPANINVRDDGTVKILDFGLAKALESNQSVVVNATQSPTITTPAMMTGVGMILGTAAYMSPEQAKGRPADKRSDIWAFGCVLFEILSGKRAFEGEDVGDTLAAVLRGEPDWDALPANLPPPVSQIVRRSLEKDRRKRIGDVSTVRFLLDEPVGASEAPSPRGADVGRRDKWTWKVGIGGIVLASTAAVLSGVAVWAARPRPTPAVVTRFPLTLPDGQQLTSSSDLSVALSPDGSRLV
jgi:eukaryotic-like serine/threonine-protein kinase